MSEFRMSERCMSEPCMSEQFVYRYFITYTGVKLPFSLTVELDEAETRNRNTFFKGCFDANGMLLSFQKLAYGEVEMEHRYSYGEDGALLRAEIIDADGDVRIVEDI